ncbi:MAG: dockerin type I repeat-containing protein [Bacteroidaceae bacterium]|nr:dockerin type I repeat-containing protein [Bacteroidaceae bacterium]
MKRFTLKQMVLSLGVATMLLSSQSVMAQYQKLTALDGMLSYGQSSVSHGEAYDKLVDRDEGTKWGGWFNPALSDEESWPLNQAESANKMYIIVKAEEAVVPTFYFLVTGGDTGTYPGRNWASWKIYGGNFDNDEAAVREGEGWTLIDDREDEPLPGENTKPVDLVFNQTDGKTAYQYFWIEVTKSVEGADVFLQMAEWGLGTHGSFLKYLEDERNKPTSTDEPVKFYYMAGAPDGFGGEGQSNLFDGASSTKWCCSFSNRQKGETKNGGFIIFKASRPMSPSYYSLTTANDTQTNAGRNWKQWQLYGMNAADEESVTRDAGWVLLDDKANVPAGNGMNQLPAANYTQSYFTLSEPNTTEYRYFKLELDQCVSDGLQQMAELTLGDNYTVVLDRDAIADAAAANYDPDLFAEKVLLDQMGALIAQVKECSDFAKLSELSAAIDELATKINTSATNYAELTTARNQALLSIDGGKLNDDAVKYLTTWANDADAVAPNNEFPIGNYAYLKANRQVTGEEAVAEANRINAFIINNSEMPEPITAEYKFLSGTTDNWNAAEGPEYLIDGQSGLNGTESTKWGTGTSQERFVIFKSINADTQENEPIQPTYYGLVTGGDTSDYPDRNWKNWKIWGANFASDEEATKNAEGWVLIDSKQNVGTDVLKTTSMFESYIYLSEGCAVPYTYFKIEVYHEGGMQMNEFTFYNTGNLAEYREAFAEQFADYDPYERPAYKGFTDAYKAKYEELKTTVNAPDVMKLKNQLVDLQEDIATSADLYEKYDSVYNEVLSLSITSESLQAWYEGYTSENLAPCAKYIRGTHAYIVENLNLDNDAIKAEMDYLGYIITAVQKDLYILLGGNTVNQWGDGFYGNLIDGIALNYTEKQIDPETGEEKEVEVKATKWGGDADANGNTYIIFRTMDKTNPFFYTLTTGNDTGSYPGRNWGTWYVYGANFEGDGDATKDAEGWVLIDSKENVGQDRLHPVNAEPSYFGFSTETTEQYTYYKVVVTKAFNGNAIQMNELHFGTPEEFEAIKQDYTDAANEFDADVVAEQALIDKYKEIIPEIEECANMEALFRVNYQLETLRDSITASAKVYSKLNDDVEAVKQYLQDYKLEESEALATLKSYIEDDIEPNETFVHGSFSTIWDEHILADSIVAEEIEFLESLKKAAVAAGYVAGTDISSLIVNRSFAKAEQVVDADGNNVSGTKQPEGWDGYVYSNGTNAEGTMSAAEFCNEQSKFTISQTLKDLKNGYYELKLNAGFRPNGDIRSLNYTAMAFANNTKTYVPVVREGMTSKENAWFGEHADREIYACDVQEAIGDPEVDSVIVGYVIWGVQGTINAILQDRYEISMVAQVTDGTLKLGLKNERTLVGGDWLGAGNFRLTYLGEEATADAIAAAAACNGERVVTLNSYAAGDFGNDINEFKAAPNFGAAQKEAVADAASRTTVEQLVADGNTFEEINATKAAYFNLCDYMIKVSEKWLVHAGPSSDFDVDIDAVQNGLKEGLYANVAATDAALAALLEKYPDYLELTEETVGNADWAEVDEFDYEFTALKNGRIIPRLGKLYDDLKANETILEFEYTAENPIEGALLYNMTTANNIPLETLEATSEYKTVSVDVKELAFTKASDVVGLALTLKEGEKVNIRHMRFVAAPSVSGDLTGDGEVNAADIQALLNIIASGEFNPAADLTGDDDVNAGDIQALLNIIAEQ